MFQCSASPLMNMMQSGVVLVEVVITLLVLYRSWNEQISDKKKKKNKIR